MLKIIQYKSLHCKKNSPIIHPRLPMAPFSYYRVLKVPDRLFTAIHTEDELNTAAGFLCFDLRGCPHVFHIR